MKIGVGGARRAGGNAQRALGGPGEGGVGVKTGNNRKTQGGISCREWPRRHQNREMKIGMKQSFTMWGHYVNFA